MSAIQACIDYARKNQLGKPQDKQSTATQAASELAAKDAELAALRQERDKLRAVVEAARKLQVKMLRVYNTPEYQTVWSIAQSHVGKYEGGNWIDEFDELAAALARVDGEKG